MVKVCAWLIDHVATKEYRRNFNALIKLGERKVYELRVERDALDARLAREPGWDPVAQQMVDPE